MDYPRPVSLAMFDLPVRHPRLSLVPIALVCAFGGACAVGGDSDSSTFGTFNTTVGDELEDEEETDESGDESSGSASDTSTDDPGDGDGDTTTTGDGDGDTTTTDDGNDDPEMCGNGVVDPGETCDGANFNGASCMVLGYDGGQLACTNCAVSTAGCTNTAQPGLGQLYSHCLVPDNCPGLDGCATVTMEGDVDPFDGYCTNFCTTDADCFANTGGTAVPQCNDAAQPFCELDCSGGKTCPGGMECVPLVGGKELCY